MLEFYGFLFILILGTISHFLYEWLDHKKAASIFFAVNESTWEHLKLIVFPFLIWLLIEVPIISNNPNFLFAKFISLIVMLLFIPIFFYTYHYFTKKDLLFLDILDFTLAIALGQCLSNFILNLSPVPFYINYLSLVFIIIIMVFFLIGTLIPGNSFLFNDPIVNQKGIPAHKALDKYFHRK